MTVVEQENKIGQGQEVGRLTTTVLLTYGGFVESPYPVDIPLSRIMATFYISAFTMMFNSKIRPNWSLKMAG